VGTFSDNAASIFEAAESVLKAGQDPTDMTIVIGQEGGIQLIAESDWPLDSLLAHHGAQMAYRVSQQDKSLRLEGRAGGRTCLFETAKLDGAARTLLADKAEYELTNLLPEPENDVAALFRTPTSSTVRQSQLD
jgi:hypothetical protein